MSEKNSRPITLLWDRLINVFLQLFQAICNMGTGKYSFGSGRHHDLEMVSMEEPHYGTDLKEWK